MLIELAIIGIIALLFYLFLISPVFQAVIYVLILVMAGVLFFKVMIKQYSAFERAIIFRFGKFHRVAGPGWSIVLPWIEKEFARVDVRTHMMDLSVPVAFTKDDLRLNLSGLFYYKIVNPEKAILKVDDYLRGIRNAVVSEVRNAINNFNMREVFANLDQLNDVITARVKNSLLKWGIDLPSIQILSVTPPEEIALAMESKQVKARETQAQRFRLEARKAAIEAMGEAAEKLDDYILMYVYLQALKELGARIPVLRRLEALKEINVPELVGVIKNKILESKKL